MIVLRPGEPKIRLLIGDPVKKGVTGSTAYFIKKVDGCIDFDVLEDHKGIFQRFDKGLLLRTFNSDKRIVVAIPFDRIKRVSLEKGREHLSPILLSPLWMLLKLSVPLEIARYFRLGISEYRISETLLRIETGTDRIDLITNGYTFNSQENFFHSCNLGARLNVTKYPVTVEP